MEIPTERDWRYARIRQAMERAELDGLLAFAPGWRRENVRYVAGGAIRGSFALAYVPIEGEPAAFAAWPEDCESIQRRGWITDLRPLALPDCREVVARLEESGTSRRIGIAHLELMPRAIVQGIRTALPRFQFVSATGLMNRVRLVKSEWELSQIRLACAVCDEGWKSFVEACRPGAREFEIVAHVEAKLKSLGAEDNFMLMASGRTEVMGMTPPGKRRLEMGDLVRTELTPQLHGYYAQICRTVVLGEPDDGQVRSSELFREAMEAGLSVTKAGATAHDIASAENDVFRKYGLGDYCTSKFTRVRGHGLGLHPDEWPPLLENEMTALEENSVIIVHPNTYTPLAGYFVFGDPVVVKKNGCESLLQTQRQLFRAPAPPLAIGNAP
jgi:Xaa-Pro aminopeptidase